MDFYKLMYKLQNTGIGNGINIKQKNNTINQLKSNVFIKCQKLKKYNDNHLLICKIYICSYNALSLYL